MKIALLAVVLLAVLAALVPPERLPAAWQDYYHYAFGEGRYREPPPSVEPAAARPEPFCPDAHPQWRAAQTIDGVEIAADPGCEADNPYAAAAAVKGTNNVSMETLMKSGLAADAVTLEDDRDGDRDPDVVHVKLEVAELNGRSPDTLEPVPFYEIAPGIHPGFWVFAPKLPEMSTRTPEDLRANPLLRLPAPTIRVEQGDTLYLTLENTHYFPHTIHLHGVDHPFVTAAGEGNDGVPEASEHPVMPGEARTYVITPRQPGTFFYHCHVQPHLHIQMGLLGMIVVEENRPANWVQTLNVGAGRVRHPSVAVTEQYDREYDLVYQDLDKELHATVQAANDPRLIAEAQNQRYDLTEATLDYFLLNGHSFPFTLRDSLLIVKPNERVKVRLLNGGLEGLSLHTHGHKVTITHTDGVAVNPVAQLVRDVVWLSPAQRLDLRLESVNDGLHSYGEGIWMIHNHKETSFTNDGIHPGGAASAIVYESFLDENGWPKTRGMDLGMIFTADYHAGRMPAWDDVHFLGNAGRAAPDPRRLAAWGAAGGLTAGFLLSRALRRRRDRRGR